MAFKRLAKSSTLLILALCLISNFSQVKSELVILTQFSDIAERVKSNPNSLSAIMVSRLEQCERCKVGNKVFEEYATLVDGVVLTYLVDCEKVWENFVDQQRIPACDPEKKHELPHITFFQPEIDELDIYNKKNKKLPKDVPYQGMVSPDALLQKSKELLPSFIKTISNVKEIDSFLNNKEIPLKLVLFTDEEHAPLFLRALSGQFRGQVDFGLADVDNKKLKKRYGITSYPALIALKQAGAEFERINYEGELVVTPVAKFLQTHLDTLVKSTSSRSNQGVYFDIPTTIEVLNIKGSQIPTALKKHKENFIIVHLQQGKSVESTKLFQKVQTDFGQLSRFKSLH